MTRDQILDFLKTNKPTLHRAFGVRRLGLFGSYARQTAREDSDIDLVVEFDEDRVTLGNFLGCKRYLEDAFGTSVDLGTESALKPIVRSAIEHEIDYV